MDGDYPEPECGFGIAIRQDIRQILKTLEQVLDQQAEFTDTLQNGLATKVQRIHNEVEEIKEERESEEERERREELREENRQHEQNTMFIKILFSNILAIGGGLLIAWLF